MFKIIFHLFLRHVVQSKNIVNPGNKEKKKQGKILQISDYLTIKNGRWNRLYFNRAGIDGPYK